MIQHTIAIPDTATALQLWLGDEVVDEFSTVPAAAPMGGADFSLSDDFAAAGAIAPADDRAVTYSIQARPVGEQIWQTLAAARSSPDYEIDPNQFGGATEVDVRVTRNRGFRSEEVSQKRTALRQ